MVNEGLISNKITSNAGCEYTKTVNKNQGYFGQL